MNGVPAFELEFGPVPLPRAQPMANQLVTCITLPARAVGLKVCQACWCRNMMSQHMMLPKAPSSYLILDNQ